MKVAGFTFIRNALLYDYPVVEAITSILPLCDHFVVAVGRSLDDTLDLVRGIGNPKIHILETEWDDSLREGGQVLAAETNKAFDAIPQEYDRRFGPAWNVTWATLQRKDFCSIIATFTVRTTTSEPAGAGIGARCASSGTTKKSARGEMRRDSGSAMQPVKQRRANSASA
jgi:hypothetical protein